MPSARPALPLSLLATLLFLLGLVSAVEAQPDPILSSVSGGPGAISNCPAGDVLASAGWGPPIVVDVRDASGAPITGITAGEFEVDGVPPSAMADGRDGLGSGPNHDVPSVTVLGPGLYELHHTLLAGGVGSSVLVKVRGVQIVTGSPLPIEFVGPDLNGDAKVNLTDISLFALELYSTSYSLRCDLLPDGVCNIADIALLATHIGHAMPSGYAIDVVD